MVTVMVTVMVMIMVPICANYADDATADGDADGQIASGTDDISRYDYMILYARRSKLHSCGEVMASLHKAPYRPTQSQHPFHQLGSTQ